MRFRWNPFWTNIGITSFYGAGHLSLTFEKVMDHGENSEVLSFDKV